jgi:hypothetical protein
MLISQESNHSEKALSGQPFTLGHVAVSSYTHMPSGDALNILVFMELPPHDVRSITKDAVSRRWIQKFCAFLRT